MELELVRGEETRRYELRIAPFRVAQREGRVIMLLDVTENRRLQAELQARSVIDDLTGLYNRRGFVGLAERQLRLAERRKQPAVLVFADLDGLKSVNDTEGHAAGDRLLVDAASVLREVCRESDIIARIGGDEFAILALDSGREGEQRLTAAIERARAERHASGGPPVSFSIGMAVFDPNAPSRTLADLLAEADEMMYRQKRSRSVVTSA